MRTSEQALSIIEQVKQAINDTAVEAIVFAAAEIASNKKALFEQLEALIGKISPLECTSQEWRNFRIARINFSKLLTREAAAC
ncbi:hypothetical protein [Chitinophaga pinensis]|uniref:Uncharacterized protein n=1 Tax=Chitinophaga pinensis (strain ATCC 43595 / DSM 2588 / LMG 13176 / NBRC 15968 / NCIMB 11800 / UQM 2034) TaxID=485918 RepID=A0A979GTH4_CHIPD|nr:hypothetical protein [Chitinophaga pinensis]ACU63787.1 hypothetical protein Cpin_6383 [Chitinophaga pinensis DSM 2588]